MRRLAAAAGALDAADDLASWSTRRSTRSKTTWSRARRRSASRSASSTSRPRPRARAAGCARSLREVRDERKLRFDVEVTEGDRDRSASAATSAASSTWPDGARAVPDRALLRALRVHDPLHAVEQRLRVAHDRRAARARARRPRAAARDLVRLHRVAPARRSCARRSPRSTSGIDPGRGDRHVLRGGGHLPALPRAAATGRPRDRRDAVLRVGARGRAQHGRRDRASGAAATRTAGRTTSTRSQRSSARTRGCSTSTSRTTRPAR